MGKKILYVTGNWEKTKSKLFREYQKREYEIISKIYESLEDGEKRYLDFVTLFPEYELKDKIVGVYDKQSLYSHKIQDLLPFYEVVLCLINMSLSVTEDEFRKKYGCTYKDFLKLVELGKILPVLIPNPYLTNEHYQFYKELLLKTPPSTLRYMKILQEDYLSDTLNDLEISGIHTKARKLLMRLCKSVFNKYNVSDPLSSKLNVLVQKPAQRGDVATAYRYIDYIAIWMESEPNSTDSLIQGLLEIDSWNEQPYIAPGVTLNYDDRVSRALQHETGLKKKYLSDLLSKIDGANENDLHKLVMFSNANPVLSADRLAILKENFFYQPPEYYGDVVQYAYWLDKSDNVKQNYKIAKAFHEDISKGNFGQSNLNDKQIEMSKVISELNREIESLEKASRVRDITLQFGANVLGATSGALASSSLESHEVTSLFTFLGATAASQIVKDYSKSLSEEMFLPIYGASNSAILIWKRGIKDQKN